MYKIPNCLQKILSNQSATFRQVRQKQLNAQRALFVFAAVKYDDPALVFPLAS